MESEQPKSGKDLSPEEMQDIVVVAMARTVPEAVFLTNTLEDEDIPAATRNELTQGLTGAVGTQILVPRALRDRAQSIINQVRGEIEQRAVESAFEPEKIAETTEEVAKDPLLAKMFMLREADSETRIAELEAFAKESLASAMQPTEVARYLAAADLDLNEADALLKRVGEIHAPEIAEMRSSRRGNGILLLGLSFLIFFGSILLFHSARRIFVVLPIGVFVTALWMITSSGQPARKLKRDDPEGPQA